MKGFTLIRFDIDYKTFEMLNFKESKLNHISLYRGKLGKLNVDALPITVKFLSLVRMGIQQLPESIIEIEKPPQYMFEKKSFERVDTSQIAPSIITIFGCVSL